MVYNSPGGRGSSMTPGRNTPSSIKFPSSNHNHNHRPTSRARSRDESPMGSPRRPRSRERSNIRGREQPSPLKIHDSTEGEAICNYDTNVTTLYELLESSNWEKARSRCGSHPHEVRTWIVRRDTISQKIRWKLLPLHAAVIFQSPTYVVTALIDQYPAAVSRRDDQGMLPLHLAFRYKEDNEDLLELLLTQYPKGVLMKDKRDRIPLEHGRGSKFSAKLLRLYADANVSGSRALTMSASADSHNIKRHEHEAAARVNEVVTEYEKKTRTLKGMYEERIKMLQDQHKAAVNQVKISSDEDKRKLVNCHVEEMEAMREMINSHAGNDAGVISDLEAEISGLGAALTTAKAERDAANLLAADTKSYADDLALQMKQLLQDQEALQLMVTQQQQELDKAHSRREQLIQNLLRQEQDERPTRSRRGSEIKQLIESGRTNMETALAREPSSRPTPKPQTSYNRARAGSNDKGGSHNYFHATTTPMTPVTPMKDDISAITENSNF
ncbi:expressed unknown protein [Seminavis robusta]|uniref:Uncharacterized protein n=1 Tax=Seminavis robusta TaxID=568900 RepID=A0A9N8HDT9_9STRA|nr:expressed unknown protein [Seminavis robusta]|eukprot:Sro272_g104810.1 n/a (499) ;mRNA; r:20737-22233